jgi:hypothetical protein
MNRDDYQSLSERFSDGDETVLKDILDDHVPTIHRALNHRFRGGLTFHDIEEVIGSSLWKAWSTHESYDPSRSEIIIYI